MDTVKWLNAHPECWEGVKKATYAYHTGHPALMPGSHSFGSEIPEDCHKNEHDISCYKKQRCHWCNRSRIEIRWDELPADCQSRPEGFPYDPSQVMLEEELRYIQLLNRAEKELPSIVKKHIGSYQKILDPITKLFKYANMYEFLWDAYGFDRDVVETIAEKQNIPGLELSYKTT